MPVERESLGGGPPQERAGGVDQPVGEAIDAGVITEEQAAADREKGIYTGWRLRMEERYQPSRWTWTAFYEGDDEWCSRPSSESDPERD